MLLGISLAERNLLGKGDEKATKQRDTLTGIVRKVMIDKAMLDDELNVVAILSLKHLVAAGEIFADTAELQACKDSGIDVRDYVSFGRTDLPHSW